MAVNFKVPESPATFLNSLTEFLGVDYNNPLELDVRHSPKMMNMILENGYLHKRHGLKIKRKIADKPVYGIWQYDVPSDEDFNEILIVHCGDKLYEVSTDFTTQTQVMSGLAEQDSYGMFMDDKLIILDGNRVIIYGKYNGVYGPQYMDQVAYIPTTTEALNPDGTNGTLIESANMMTPFRINTFISDGTSTVYHTDSNTISTGIGDTTVWKLNASTGNWDLVDDGAYTVSADNTITFYEPIEATPITGAPNVKIQFKSTTEDLANRINKCRFCAPFGYRGNNKAMFYSGNPDVPNCDWHSEIGLGINVDPTYVPDDTFTVIGSQPIIGYLRLSNGTLAILKNLTDSDCSIYYRTSNTYSNYYVYPLTKGTKNIGCLSNYTCVNIRNADLFLSEQGVCAAVTDDADSALERYADNKSYYINKNLLLENNLERARALGIDDYYYLFINNKVYVGDSAKLTQTANNTIYQYQWYVFDNIPARNVMRWNNKVVIGDDEGYIKMFGNDYIDEIRYITENNNTNTKTKNVECYFETIPLDFSNPIIAKTTRNFLLNYIAEENTKFDFGYRTIDEEEVVSETVYKLVSGNMPNDNNTTIDYPYGTQLNFDTTKAPSTTSSYGINGYYYGTQTETSKNFIGFYKPEDSNILFGIFNIDLTDYDNPVITPTKIFYDTEYRYTKFIIKKLLHGKLLDINNDTNIPSLNLISLNFNDITLGDPILNKIPQTLRIKEKARKIMFLKLYVESTELACEFDRMYIEYRKAGKYRGE